MRLLLANEVEEKRITDFLKTTDRVDKNSLLREGYVVEIGEEIKGCFVLAPVEENVYWLKQLYISQEAAQSLPALLETIIVLAKTKNAKKVYVHSHQPVVDILLGALQFHPQKEALNVNMERKKQGNWWAYEVS